MHQLHKIALFKAVATGIYARERNNVYHVHMQNMEDGVKQLQAVTSARIQAGLDTDHELYQVINRKPESSIYELAKITGWTTGKVYASVRRLKKDHWIKSEKCEKDGRIVTKVTAVDWPEFFTREELEEFKNMDF